VSDSYIIEPLGVQDRSAFSCGSEALDGYFRERASQDVKRLIASCFVATEDSDGEIAGYYTLAATSIAVTDLPSELTRRLPRYPTLPAALVGRLAVDRRHHRKGLGSALIADAATRVLKGDVKAFALVVEAKDEAALAFYRKLGFARLVSRPLSLFLPLETIRQVGGR
jgi:ribosomal protein S18 acetylase RimI-like enzyme